eukprot:3073453-Rhodomonas_salina.1
MAVRKGGYLLPVCSVRASTRTMFGLRVPNAWNQHPTAVQTLSVPASSRRTNTSVLASNRGTNTLSTCLAISYGVPR